MIRASSPFGAGTWGIQKRSKRWTMYISVTRSDAVHLCDKSFHLLSTQPILGEWVARITGAEMVQLWSSQLFIKPAGGGEGGNIGWHTDRDYWPYWDGEVLTVWLALGEVTRD